MNSLIAILERPSVAPRASGREIVARDDAHDEDVRVEVIEGMTAARDDAHSPRRVCGSETPEA